MSAVVIPVKPTVVDTVTVSPEPFAISSATAFLAAAFCVLVYTVISTVCWLQYEAEKLPGCDHTHARPYIHTFCHACLSAKCRVPWHRSIDRTNKGYYNTCTR
jgi:hypothetical protein